MKKVPIDNILLVQMVSQVEPNILNYTKAKQRNMQANIRTYPCLQQ